MGGQKRRLVVVRKGNILYYHSPNLYKNKQTNEHAVNINRTDSSRKMFINRALQCYTRIIKQARPLADTFPYIQGCLTLSRTWRAASPGWHISMVLGLLESKRMASVVSLIASRFARWLFVVAEEMQSLIWKLFWLFLAHFRLPLIPVSPKVIHQSESM